MACEDCSPLIELLSVDCDEGGTYFEFSFRVIDTPTVSVTINSGEVYELYDGVYYGKAPTGVDIIVYLWNHEDCISARLNLSEVCDCEGTPCEVHIWEYDVSVNGEERAKDLKTELGDCDGILSLGLVLTTAGAHQASWDAFAAALEAEIQSCDVIGYCDTSQVEVCWEVIEGEIHRVYVFNSPIELLSINVTNVGDIGFSQDCDNTGGYECATGGIGSTGECESTLCEYQGFSVVAGSVLSFIATLESQCTLNITLPTCSDPDFSTKLTQAMVDLKDAIEACYPECDWTNFAIQYSHNCPAPPLGVEWIYIGFVDAPVIFDYVRIGKSLDIPLSHAC